MMHVPETSRISQGPLGSVVSDGNNGAFAFPGPEPGWALITIASDGLGWEHVSVRAVRDRKSRTPNWREMQFVKELFWDDEDGCWEGSCSSARYSAWRFRSARVISRMWTTSLNRIGRCGGELMARRKRFVLEATWRGYDGRPRVVHREALTVFRDRYAAIQSIVFTDGTLMYVTVRDATPRERLTEIHGYTAVLHGAALKGLSGWGIDVRAC